MARGSSQRKKQSLTDRERAKKPQNGQPKSMVIRIGAQEVGSSVSQLVQDVRHVMEPDTAVRLKVWTHGLSFICAELIFPRNEEPTNSKTTPPCAVPSACRICSSSRAQSLETQIFVLRAPPVGLHYTSAFRITPSARTSSNRCDTRGLAQTTSWSRHFSS